MWLTRDGVLGELGDGRQAEQRYQSFVEAGAKAGVSSPWEQVVAQVALGDERFVASLRQRVSTAAHRELPSRRQLAERPSWAAIERAVRLAAPTLQALATGRRSDPERAVLVYLARERGGLSLRDVARKIGREEATVSQHARRVAERRRTDTGWDRAIETIEQAFLRN
jgi:DNA-binding NarL/FixJ family response regulator